MTFENLTRIFFLFSLIILTGNNSISAEEPEPFTIVITEIMADPTPAVGLPPYEFIEIFNRGKEQINLEGWVLTVGSYVISLPAFGLKPGSYAVICDHSATPLLSGYGNIIPVEAFPPILNTGQNVWLSYNSGIIHSVIFDEGWYGGSFKSAGGWSLEMIDRNNPCGGVNNWAASIDNQGGTPGRKNSVDSDNPDFERPELIRAFVLSDSLLQLIFSEPLAYPALTNKDNYSVNFDLLQPDSAYCTQPEHNSVMLGYSRKFRENLFYTVSVRNTLCDCAGNPISGNQSLIFGLPHNPGITDIVFNEVLIDPAENDAEFVELYNRSDKIINLSGLILILVDASTGEPEKSICLYNFPFQILPGMYVVLSKNIQSVIANHGARANTLLQIPLFTLPNEEGILVLTDSTGNIIDEFHYYSSMHHPLLVDASGVSLERINPDMPSADAGNWESASSLSGYATPGCHNSQENLSENEPSLELFSEYVSPDNDGIEDEIIMALDMPEGGWIGTVKIYSIDGVPVRNLFTNYLLGTYEQFVWDGRYGDGKPAETGLYIIYGEFFNKQGRVKNFKKVVAVVNK